MDCATLKGIFAGENGEDLDEAQSRSFEEHLDSCASCREALAEAEQQLAPLGEWEPPVPTPEQWAGVDTKVKALAAVQPAVILKPQRANLPAMLLLAAMFLLAGGVGIMLITQPKPGSGGQPAQMTANPTESPAAPEAATLLQAEAADGFTIAHHTLDDELLCVVIADKQ